MGIGNAEDTSLALPSDDKLRTGQQRVLDQVHTIKRSKSKKGSPFSSPTCTENAFTQLNPSVRALNTILVMVSKKCDML